MVDRRQTLLYGGGSLAIVTFVFTIAAMGNDDWLGAQHPKSTTSGPPNRDVKTTDTIGVFRGNDNLENYLNNISYSTPLKATQAFVVLGFFCTLTAAAASVYGGWKQNASHPWPKVAFLSFAFHCLFNFCALVAFAVVKHKIGGEDYVSAGYEGGYAPIILLFFMNLGMSIFLAVKFGIAGVLGTGALPEGTTQFTGESMGGYQVSEETA